MGIPLSVYLSPVILGLVIVLIDLVNLITPTPDLGHPVMSVIENLVDGEPGALQALSWIGFLWLVPGVVALLATYVLIRWRLHRIGGDDLAASLGARPPNDQDAEERQLVDVVGELANAAGIEPPRVQLYDSPPANALVYGRDPDHATVLVGRGLLAELDREATQGLVARLTASAGDGDLGLATDVGAVYVTYGLVTTALSAVVSHAARQRLRAGLAGLFGRSGNDAAAGVAVSALLGLASDDDTPDTTAAGCLTLLTMGGLIGVGVSLINLFLAGPLLVFAWRPRVHLGDATAVDLTRNPTALAGALRALGDGRGLPGSGWLELLLIVGGGRSAAGGGSGGRALSDTGLAARLDPSVASRIARLEAMGAVGAGDPGAVRPIGYPRPPRRPLLILVGLLIIVPLIVLIGVLVLIATALIVFLVAFASYVVLLIAAGPVHELLRGLAGR